MNFEFCHLYFGDNPKMLPNDFFSLFFFYYQNHRLLCIFRLNRFESQTGVSTKRSIIFIHIATTFLTMYVNLVCWSNFSVVFFYDRNCFFFGFCFDLMFNFKLVLTPSCPLAQKRASVCMSEYDLNVRVYVWLAGLSGPV